MKGLVCSRDASLCARVTRIVPLLYTDGPNEKLDRPAHVRAGSSLVLIAPHVLAIVQDDANFVALVNLDKMHVTSVPLPADKFGKRLFDEKRGTKKEKMDLEACVVDDDGRIILLGSGSSAKRESIAVVMLGDKNGIDCGNTHDSTCVMNAHTLYACLRNIPDFAGSDLNIEGATRVGDVIRLFNRNNGEVKADVQPVNASCDLNWDHFMDYVSGSSNTAPVPFNICQYALGQLGGVSLGFTDATCADSHVFFSGSAEDSPNSTSDGPVTGSIIGVFRSDGACRWIEVVDGDNHLFAGKIEGLVVLPGGRTGYAIVDRDSTDIPSELLFLELQGFLP